MKKSRGNYEYSVTKGGFSSIFPKLSHFFDNPRQSCYNIMVIYYTTWRNTMLQAADLKQELNLLQPRLEDLRSAIGYEALLNKKEELELKVSAPGFWDNLENSQKILKLQKEINDKVAHFEELMRKYDDTVTMMELIELEAPEDEAMLGELKDAIRQIDKTIEEKKLETLLSGDYDHNSAIMSFHAGAGGTEAQDWA
ncbi:MAG: PCRF domain-containing protein, partial [Ruminococcaceae bacterium]|nr:PCRF domain-containing protein [Oscillospiraceae bacterium]